MKAPDKVYWLTRDSSADGVLSEAVDVWLERPVRSRLPGGGVMWLGPGDTGIESRYQTWTLDQARAEVRWGAPATDLESVMVGIENETSV